MKTKTLQNKNNLFLSILKGAIVALSCTLILILIFALIIRFFNIYDNWIFPVNQVIKIISIFAGIITMFKSTNNKGFIKGLLFGIVYFLISFITFSILQTKISFDLGNFYDMLLTIFMSGLIGIIVVNIKK